MVFLSLRYIALQNNKDGQGPLASYFKGEVLSGGGRQTSVFTSNMYLAEDVSWHFIVPFKLPSRYWWPNLQRILCFELVAKANAAWSVTISFSLFWILSDNWSAGSFATWKVLLERRTSPKRFLSSLAKGDVGWMDLSLQVCKNIAGFHGLGLTSTIWWWQAVYAIAHVPQILRSNHTKTRKFALMAESLYNLIGLVFSWFSIVSLSSHERKWCAANSNLHSCTRQTFTSSSKF